jgi:UDP-GlcNAc:undecaprenyl-phosphate/decaprenyl-phosphate GlcNAc-1-phosphate transferase
MTVETVLAWLGALIGGTIMSVVCNLLLLRFSQSLGIRNKNDVTIRWANESKPSLGGVSFFIAFVFGSIGYSIVFQNEYIFHNREYIGLLFAGIVAFVMGLADDAYNTKPLAKLFFQIACGCILVACKTIIHLTGNSWMDALITVIWVVGIMNSLNMLDNMDGITGTTVLFILIACLGSDFIVFGWNMNIWTITLIIQIGALIGFLQFNIHPSQMFMGDAGSQFIGFFTAFFSIKNLWNVGIDVNLNPYVGVLITLHAFTPAAVDTFTVVINRLRKGKSPMVGGKDHTTHHLVYAGFNDRKVWLIFLLMGLSSTLITLVSVHFCRLGNPYIALFCVLHFLILFILLYKNTVKYKQKTN